MDSVAFTGVYVARSVNKAPKEVKNLITVTSEEVANYADKANVNVRFLVKDASWTTKFGQHIHIGDRLYMIVDKKRHMIPDFLMHNEFCEKIRMLLSDPVNAEDFKNQVFKNIERYKSSLKPLPDYLHSTNRIAGNTEVVPSTRA